MSFKHYGLFLSICVVGMLSVSLSNLFGGNYGVCVAIMAVLSTLLVFVLLDKNLISNNKLNLILTGILFAFELVFFVTNDIVEYTVYDKNDVGFFGGLVIASQVYSILLAIYFLVRIVLSFVHLKDLVEVVEHVGQNYDDVNDINEEVKEEKNVEIKRITRSTEKKDVPFMEENL